MSIGLGSLASGYSGSMADVYRLYLENSLRQRQAAQAQEADFADFVRRNQYLQGIQAPALARQQAQQELDAFQRTYPQEQIRSNPILQARWAELSQRAGFAIPTRAVPETTGIPGQRTAEGGLSQFLSRVGTQQIPTGQMVNQPILPQVPAQTQDIVIVNRATGATRTIQVPAGARVEAYTPPTGPAQSVLVDPTTGRVIQRFPPGVTVHVAPKPTPAEKPAAPTETVDGKALTLAQIEAEMQGAGLNVGSLRKLLAQFDDQNDPGKLQRDKVGPQLLAASQRLQRLTAARTRLLRRLNQKPTRTVGAAPVAVAGAPIRGSDLDQFYK